MLQGLNFVLMHVPSIEQVRSFYTETFGLQVEAENPTFVQFKQPGGSGATFSLIADPSPVPAKDTELWWYVDDADKEYNRLRDAGAAIESAPKDEPFGRAFAIKDPAGNVLNLLQLKQ